MLFILNSLGSEWMKQRLKLLAILTEPQNVQKLFSFRPMQTTLMSDTCKQWPRGREREREGSTQELSQCTECAYEECQVAAHSWLALWQQASSQLPATWTHVIIQLCEHLLRKIDDKRRTERASDCSGHFTLNSTTHSHTCIHSHRYLYSFVCWDSWKKDS